MNFKSRKDGFLIKTRSGRVTVYSWWALTIPACTAIFFTLSLLFFSHPTVQKSVVRAMRNPSLQNCITAIRFFGSVTGKSIAVLTSTPHPKQDSTLPTLHLDVPPNTIEKMFALHREYLTAAQLYRMEKGEQQIDAHPYFKATLVDENETTQAVKIKLRGLSAWHHEKAKPSLRVKYPKTDIYQGWRYMELSRPKEGLAMSNWLPDSIGAELGLFSDRGDHVRLFINRKHYGVYRRTRRMGEPLAISNNRMPGTFFKGEFAKEMWQSSEGWKVFGEPTAHNRERFEHFLQVLNSPNSANTLTELKRSVNPERMAQWAALNVLSGSTHTDKLHNHAYFVNSNEGQIEPIPWDVGFAYYHAPTLPVDSLTGNPVLEKFMCDPHWCHLRNTILYSFVNTSPPKFDFKSEADRKITMLMPDLHADRHLQSMRYYFSSINQHPWSAADLDPERSHLLDWIDQRVKHLQSYLNSAVVYVEDLSSDKPECRISVAGNVGVVVDIPGETETRLLLPGLSKQTFRWQQEKKPDVSTFGSPAVSYVKPGSLNYLLNCRARDLKIRNAITGAIVTARTAPQPHHPLRSCHPDDFETQATGSIRIGPGEVHVKEDIIIGPKQSLTIIPGTKLLISPGVGIYSRGPVFAQGTKTNRIQIMPAGKEPWAALGVSGRESNGSIFRNVHIEGGSTGVKNGILFKGMLSVYNCPDLTFSECTVGRNFIGDDAVNFAQSHVTVSDCIWNDALSDALDLDMCTGTIRNSSWKNSGNDAIDLMKCDVRISNCKCVGSGDKGVSVGEGTEALINNCLLSECEIGIEVKDSSKAFANETRFEFNNIALNAYQKKWMFSRGGEILLRNCKFKGSNRGDVSIEPRSELTLVGTKARSVINGANRITRTSIIERNWQPLANKIAF